jgi:hypothetical protein
VAHQATGCDGLAQGINRGNRVSGRQRDNPFPMGVRERAGTDQQRANAALHERCKRCLDVALAADIENGELLPDRLRRRLHLPSLPASARAGAAAPVASPECAHRERPDPPLQNDGPGLATTRRVSRDVA